MWVPFEYYLEAQCQFLAVSTDIWWVNYLVTGCQGVTNTLLPPLHHQLDMMDKLYIEWACGCFWNIFWRLGVTIEQLALTFDLVGELSCDWLPMGFTYTLLPPLHHQTRSDRQALIQMSMWITFKHFGSWQRLLMDELLGGWQHSHGVLTCGYRQFKIGKSAKPFQLKGVKPPLWIGFFVHIYVF